MFHRVEGEAADIPQTTGLAAVIGRVHRERAILDQQQAGLAGGREDSSHVTRQAEIVNDNRRPGARPNGGRKSLGIDIAAIGLHIDEYRSCPTKFDCVRRRYVSHGRHDHLVPGSHAVRKQREMETCCT